MILFYLLVPIVVAFFGVTFALRHKFLTVEEIYEDIQSELEKRK